MKTTLLLLALLPCLLPAQDTPPSAPSGGGAPPASGPGIPNPRVDYAGFVQTAGDVEKIRAGNLVSEDEFIRLMKEPKTVVLDARSKARFDEMHVKGALHLDLTDFNAPALAKLVPDKTIRILIYCNNNFEGAEKAYPAKAMRVALNVQTYINLHTYGYTNVKELAPLIPIAKVKIPMEGTEVSKAAK